MISIGIDSIGVIGPGINGWDEMVEILSGTRSFNAQDEMPKHPPHGLPVNERRRTTPMIRMVLQCCEDTLSRNAGDLPQLRSVFSSSNGDELVVDRILRALTLPGKPVSPTQFHYSVFNAPAGYWSITRSEHASSISLSADDASFGAGLLEAAVQVCTGGGPTLLVAYDFTPPPALAPHSPCLAPFAIGMLIVDQPARWHIRVATSEENRCDLMRDASLEAMRLGNSAARSLPLLGRLAAGRPGTITVPYLSELSIAIDVE